MKLNVFHSMGHSRKKNLESHCTSGTNSSLGIRESFFGDMMSSEDLASGKRRRGTLQVSGIVYVKTLCGAERAVQLKAHMVRIRRQARE